MKRICLASVMTMHRATMIASNVTQARTTLLMRLKFLMMRCGFLGRDDVPSFGMNGECDQVKRGEAPELEEFSWSDLPVDLVRFIISKLVRYEDKAKLACVCKSWKGIIRTIPRVYPAGKNPLLIHIKSRGGQGEGALIQYYSPWLNKAFQARSSLDLRRYEIISAKGGWLLMYKHKQDEMRMELADPFGGSSILFPGIRSNTSFNGTAIGLFCGSYAIFLIDTSHENQVIVHLYRKAVGWALDLVYDNGSEPFHLSSNPVYFDGRFYCLGSSKGDRLGVFDLLQRTWNLYSVKFMNKYHDDDIRCCYLVDWIDTVMMVVQVNNYGSGTHLFRLDRKKMVWKETDDLCGRSLFLGPTLSAMSLHPPKMLQNRVFLPDCHQDEPNRVIVVEPFFHHDQFYFRSKSCISCEEKDHAATTMCCCNNSGEEEDSLYFGSTQNHKYCTMWYQPGYAIYK